MPEVTCGMVLDLAGPWVGVLYARKIYVERVNSRVNEWYLSPVIMHPTKGIDTEHIPTGRGEPEPPTVKLDLTNLTYIYCYTNTCNLHEQQYSTSAISSRHPLNTKMSKSDRPLDDYGRLYIAVNTHFLL